MQKTDVQNKIDIKAYLSAADKFWIGGQLRGLRQAQGIGVPEAARLINGTQSQILAIESGSQGPFGSTENYVKGILTYAGQYDIAPESPLGVKLAELAAIVTGQLKDHTSASGIDSLMQSSLSSSSAFSAPRLQGKRVFLASLVLSAILLVALTAFELLPFSAQIKTTLGLSRESKETSAPVIETSPVTARTEEVKTPNSTVQAVTLPATVKPVETSPPKDNTKAATAPEATPPVKPSPAQALHFKFNAPCWIQATAQDGKVTEKIYGVTDQLVLDTSNLKALIVGNVEATTVSDSQGKTLSLKTFANQSSKVARLKEQDFGALIRERN